jgi:hypothetical protein
MKGLLISQTSEKTQMRIKKIITRIILLLLFITIGLFIWFTLTVFPAISGYGSKNLCSAVYLQHRNPADVIKEDLADFPLSLGTFTVNEKDSSVTGSVCGFTKRKTIYRKRIGCTLINDFSEEDVRKQQFSVPSKPNIDTDTIPWPYGDRITNTITASINKVQLQKAVDNVMNGTTADGKPGYTRAVLVVYDGNIIAEKYAAGYDKNTLMLGWSMSKSLIAAMIGILVKKINFPLTRPHL